MTSLLGSFREAQALLRQRGIALSVNTLRTIAYQYAERVRAAQQAKKQGRMGVKAKTVCQSFPTMPDWISQIDPHRMAT